MLLRILRGRVLAGREDEFVAISRRQLREGGRSPGLISFMAGYRRLDGGDRCVLVSGWESAGDVVRAVGDEPLKQPRSAEILAGVAEIERIEQFALLEPVHRGILDAPGAVLRLTEATIRPGRRSDLLAWVARKSRDIDAARLLLGWSIGLREEAGAERIVGVSAWASPLLIEGLAEPGRQGTTLFAALDEFVTDARVEQYQAIELRLPERMHDIGGRRVIAARFGSADEAEAAKTMLESRIASANEAGVSVARLADGARVPKGDQRVVVARVVLAEYLPAERLIADLGGQVVYEADEARA